MDNLCSICLESLESDINVTVCAHKFHTDCLNEWIARNPSCPICRYNLNDISPSISESISIDDISNNSNNNNNSINNNSNNNSDNSISSNNNRDNSNNNIDNNNNSDNNDSNNNDNNNSDNNNNNNDNDSNDIDEFMGFLLNDDLNNSYHSSYPIIISDTNNSGPRNLYSNDTFFTTHNRIINVSPISRPSRSSRLSTSRLSRSSRHTLINKNLNLFNIGFIVLLIILFFIGILLVIYYPKLLVIIILYLYSLFVR